MMVKQSLATAEGAANLYHRALKGDALVDAAIEAYAADKDVAEFLDTLQILASHSAEGKNTNANNAIANERQDMKIMIRI
jgi:hypothetical protein